MPLKIVIGCGAAVLAALGASGAGHVQTSRQDAPHRCAAAAVEQARALLAFHVGPDDRISVGRTATPLAPVRNPANRAQRLDVLEVWGDVYKGRYRMRLIYARVPGDCVLMGQEILEHADL